MVVLGVEVVQGEEVFSSSAHLKRLVQVEQWLVTGVERYVANERARIDQIERYIIMVHKYIIIIL